MHLEFWNIETVPSTPWVVILLQIVSHVRRSFETVVQARKQVRLLDKHSNIYPPTETTCCQAAILWYLVWYKGIKPNRAQLYLISSFLFSPAQSPKFWASLKFTLLSRDFSLKLQIKKDVRRYEIQINRRSVRIDARLCPLFSAKDMSIAMHLKIA